MFGTNRKIGHKASGICSLTERVLKGAAHPKKCRDRPDRFSQIMTLAQTGVFFLQLLVFSFQLTVMVVSDRASVQISPLSIDPNTADLLRNDIKLVFKVANAGKSEASISKVTYEFCLTRKGEIHCQRLNTDSSYLMNRSILSGANYDVLVDLLMDGTAPLRLDNGTRDALLSNDTTLIVRGSVSYHDRYSWIPGLSIKPLGFCGEWRRDPDLFEVCSPTSGRVE